MFYKSSLSSFTQLIVYSWKNNPFLFYSEREIPAMLDLILIVLCEFNFYGWNFLSPRILRTLFSNLSFPRNFHILHASSNLEKECIFHQSNVNLILK